MGGRKGKVNYNGMDGWRRIKGSKQGNGSTRIDLGKESRVGDKRERKRESIT